MTRAALDRITRGTAMAFALMVLLCPVALAQDAPPRVLLLFSNDRLLPANIEIEKGFRDALAGHAEPVDIYAEFLDIVRFPDEAQQEGLMRYLNERYAARPPRVIVVLGPQGHAFLAAHRQQLFPDKPVVIGAVDADRIASEPVLPNSAVRTSEWTVAPILRELPKRRPDLRKVLLVAGDDPFDHRWIESAMADVAETGTPLEVTASMGEHLDTLRRKVAGLPDDSVVVFLSYFLTPDGIVTIPRDIGNDLAKVASVPVLGSYDTFLGDGVTGVCTVPFRDEGLAIGEITLRLLNGEKADDIGVLPPAEPRFIFDARQLRRWDWDADDLPAGSEIRFRRPGLWEEHRNTMLGGTAVLVLQSGLITGLVLARRRQKRIEARLRRSEGRFAGIFRGSPSAIAVVRASDGSLADVNPAWERITGRHRGECLDRSLLEVGFLIEGDAGSRIDAFLKSGRKLHGYEQPVRAADGSELLLSLATEQIQLHGEDCHVVMASDVTAEHEVDEARRQLTRSSRLAMLGEMTASIAHEVNQPLGAILSNADAAGLLLERPEPPLDAVRQILADIRRDDLRASEVIQRVRGLVKRNETRSEPLEIATFIRGTARLLEGTASRRGVELRIETEEGLAEIRADRVQLEQVLLNLTLNAMDAMEDTPVALRRVTLSARSLAPNRVRITVSDRGTGIASSHLDRLFHSFFTTKSEGMGLGLSLSRSIAEAHSGTIHAENNPFGGADFHLDLPLGDAVAT